MSIVSTIALSGLNAASLRVQVAASNIANASSSGPLPDAAQAANFPPAYQALTVDQTAAPGGGTWASVSMANPGTVPTANPGAPYANGAGLVASPNVDLTSQIVDLLTAQNSFAANAAMMRTDAQMSALLLNMLA